MKRFLFFALALGVFLGVTSGPVAAQGAAATTLTVNVTGFKNSEGMCVVWLFNRADGFPNDPTKLLRRATVPVRGKTSQAVFANLPAGTYAVSVIHDENNNKRLDTNCIGIPKEPYGTSRGVRGVTGPPKFAPASFAVSGAALALAIRVE